MTTSMDTSELREQLVDDLTTRGFLRSDRWREAFLAVRREEFVTRFMVPSPTGDHQHYDLADPDQHGPALSAVYGDTPLITQQDAGGTATSSSTAPSLMALMLEALDASRGMTALEVGTGTGYNAGLLCHVLGDDAVSSVDLDPLLVSLAREALDRNGYSPHVGCVNGADGLPQRAPYDRLIATCGVSRIPEAWLRQVRPGGVIVVNVGFGLARLIMGPDGGASGPFIEYASFMQLRHHRGDVAHTVSAVLAMAAGPSETRTVLLPAVLDEREVIFLRSVMLPNVRQVVAEHPDGPEYVLADPATTSWARIRLQHDGTATVTEGGQRHLARDLARIAVDWVAASRPPITAYKLAISADGQHELRLDGGPHRWTL